LGLSRHTARFSPPTPPTDEQIRTVLAWPDATLITQRGDH